MQTVVAAIAFAATPASACDSPDALGTSRVMAVDVAKTVGIGDFQFDTPPLAPGEVILTFDDGPAPWSTPAILDTLKRECAKATFFMIGERAAKVPDLAERIRTEGHTVASHTYSHKDLRKLPLDAAEKEIVDGYTAVETAAYGTADDARPRFFRFPDFHATPELIAFGRDHDITVVSADMSPQDWKGGPPEETLARLTALLDKRKRGIIVLHDNQKNTAALLPLLFAELKARGMRLVHIEPQ